MVTFSTLLPLFAGKSINTAGFLLAALKKEGLVGDSADKARCYQIQDAKLFFEQLKALMPAAAKAAPGKAAAKKSVAKKAPGKAQPAKK